LFVRPKPTAGCSASERSGRRRRRRRRRRMSACILSYFSYLTCKSHLFYAALYCHQRPVLVYHIFPHYLIYSSILERAFEHKICVLNFSTTFCLESFSFSEEWKDVLSQMFIGLHVN
jgi:hypothetical protein